jgi:hypothetical protein
MHYSTITVPGIVTAVGIGLLAIIGAVHLVYAPGYYTLVPYVGALFYATVAGAIVAAVGVMCGARLWGWMLGVLLAAATLAAYVVSRTIGLPQFPILPWQDPFGLAALAAEALFIMLGLIVLGALGHVFAVDRTVMATERQRIHEHDASLS